MEVCEDGKKIECKVDHCKATWAANTSTCVLLNHLQQFHKIQTREELKTEEKNDVDDDETYPKIATGMKNFPRKQNHITKLLLNHIVVSFEFICTPIRKCTC